MRLFPADAWGPRALAKVPSRTSPSELFIVIANCQVWSLFPVCDLWAETSGGGYF